MTSMQASASVCEICPVCGEKKTTVVEMLGKKHIMPIMCRCRREELLKREQEDHNNQQRLRLERLRQYSLMDRKFDECRFESFEMDERNQKHYGMALKYCERWPEMKQKNVGFMLWGPPGAGKTYIAFCIANRLLEQGVPVIAISSIGLLHRIKKTYDRFGKEGEVEIINTFKNASLFVLDDLGAENGTVWAKEKIYEIIDSRYRDGKPMIVTTNLIPEQLKKKLTAEDGVVRTYDRLIEMCYPIEIKGPSRRAKAAGSKAKIIKELLK